MAQWEYLTLFLEARVHKGDDERLKKRFNRKKLPKYTPERLIPELDQLGEDRWELVHMEPVAKVGGKGDILFQGAPRWSNTYFCVFKRPRLEPLTQAAPYPQQAAATPAPVATPPAAPLATPAMPPVETPPKG